MFPGSCLQLRQLRALSRQGRYVPEKFEEIFSKFDTENKGGLTLGEMYRMTNNNANAYDIFGWTVCRLMITRSNRLPAQPLQKCFLCQALRLHACYRALAKGLHTPQRCCMRAAELA